MARLTGPLFSMSASGTIGDAITYGSWKGIAWARSWFIPSNPQTATQTNVRLAMSLLVAYWQIQAQGEKDIWNTFAEGTGMSGFNQMVKRGMDAYIADHGSAVVPISVSKAGAPPADVWTWVV